MEKDSAPKKKDERLLRYEREKRRQHRFNLIGYTLVICAGMLLLMILAGDYTQSFLSYFGINTISNEQAGLYADCSLPENRGKGFCAGRKSAVETRWDRLERKESSPFQIR